MQVALEHRGEVLVVLMGAVDATSDIRSFFGVAGHALPTAVFSDMRRATDAEPQGFQQTMTKDAALTAESLAAFAAEALKVAAGKAASKEAAGWGKAAGKGAAPNKKKASPRKGKSKSTEL